MIKKMLCGGFSIDTDTLIEEDGVLKVAGGSGESTIDGKEIVIEEIDVSYDSDNDTYSITNEINFSNILSEHINKFLILKIVISNAVTTETFYIKSTGIVGTGNVNANFLYSIISKEIKFISVYLSIFGNAVSSYTITAE